jgi:integrase
MERPKAAELAPIYARWDATPTMVKYFDNITKVGEEFSASKKLYRSATYGFFRWKGTDPESWMGGVNSKTVDPVADIQDFIKHMYAQKASLYTLRTYQIALLKFAYEMGLGELKVRGIATPEPKRKIVEFSPETIKPFLKSTTKHYALFLLAATSGLRVGEIAGLTVKDLEEVFTRKEGEPYAITVPNEIAKGNRGYTTFTTEEAAEQIRALVKIRKLNDEDRVFPHVKAIDKAFQRYVKKFGLEGGRRFHSFRKFVRSQLAHAEVPEIFTERLIGHRAGIQHTYTIAQIEEMRDYYKKALPRLTFFSGESKETKEKVARVEDKLKALEKENAELKEFMRARVESLERIVEKARGASRPPLKWEKSK